jgi:hypothetical protein
MEIAFRRFLPEEPDVAPADELHVRPRPGKDVHRIDMACLALERGVDGFVHGEGPLVRLVVKIEPTLDDMLAALLLQEERAGRKPAGAGPLAHYAAAVRRGVRPAPAIPLEDSPEALFLALRQDAGRSLQDETTPTRFLQGWEKMAAVLRPALDAGTDPHQKSLFADRPEFTAERAFLRKDHEVYQRDVTGARRWWLYIPGAPAPVPAVYLRDPQSTVFQFWARQDPRAPGRAGYGFLAVSWPKGDWTFSTDPTVRLAIQGLATELQVAEAARNPQAARDPWYDGRRHQYTIVGAPHGGSRLGEEEVLGILTRWGHARPIRPLVGAARPAAVVASAGVLLGGALLGLRLLFPAPPVLAATQQTPKGDPGPLYQIARAGTVDNVKSTRPVSFHGPVSVPAHADVSRTLPLTGTDTGSPVKFWVEFLRAPQDVEVRMGLAGAQEQEVQVVPDGEGGARTSPVRGKLPPDRREATVHIRNRADRPVVLDLNGFWQPAPRGLVNLYVQAIGVSEPEYERAFRDLDYPPSDARELTEELRRQQGPLFFRVRAQPPLVNKDANRFGILGALDRLVETVKHEEDRDVLQMAVIAFSGHGAINPYNSFVFLPHDYWPRWSGSDLTWWDLKMRLDALVDHDCSVLLVLDCCHSGMAVEQLLPRGSKGELPDDEVSAKIRSFEEQKPGLVVVAAARARQLAWESYKVKHGVLTGALLEALRGQDTDQPVITLGDVLGYLNRRVKELAKDTGEQRMVPWFSPGVDPSDIPIAYRHAPAGAAAQGKGGASP